MRSGHVVRARQWGLVDKNSLEVRQKWDILSGGFQDQSFAFQG